MNPVLLNGIGNPQPPGPHLAVASPFNDIQMLAMVAALTGEASPAEAVDLAIEIVAHAAAANKTGKLVNRMRQVIREATEGNGDH